MDVIKLFNLINELKEETNQLEEYEFRVTLAMLMEEWCLTHNEDVVGLAEELLKSIKEVNEEAGKYGA